MRPTPPDSDVPPMTASAIASIADEVSVFRDGHFDSLIFLKRSPC
jgi:hypothetical protein